MNKLSLVLRVAAAVIMLQTLYYKFTAHPDSVHIFTTIGMEPWGRIGVGVQELVASVLLLVPATAWLGAALTLGLMSGAIFFHLAFIGIETNGDGGKLFGLAVACLLCAAVVAWQQRERYLRLLPGRRGSRSSRGGVLPQGCTRLASALSPTALKRISSAWAPVAALGQVPSGST
ncbi:MAG: DoxX family protein [Cytophagales bacterium]|nr:DoxX family protein [Cytophagales bacterium]